MPPRSALANTFAPGEEVFCPLKNHDGSNCRKRCFGEKRYRSMQEHIRRAHPDYYIPKLPATEESFRLMIETAPVEKPKKADSGTRSSTPVYESTRYHNEDAAGSVSKHNNTIRRPSILPAATALAQLHNSRVVDHDWDADHMDHIVCDDMPAFSYESSHYQDIYPQVDPEASYSLHNYLHGPDDPYRSRVPHSPLPKNVSPTELMRMPVPIPSSRASSSQPVPRLKISKPRKNSVGEYSRKRKYEGEHIGDFKKFGRGTKEPSAESSSVFGNRWEELLEAAASASEADGQSRNQTPNPSPRPAFGPLHGFNSLQTHSYTASPLQNSILPRSPIEVSPRFDPPHLEPFPSVESSYDVHPPPPDHPYMHHHSPHESLSGHPYSPSHPYHYSHHNTNSSGSSYNMPPETIATSPETTNHRYSTNNIPAYPPEGYSPPTSAHLQQAPSTPPLVQHYCAACHRVAPLSSSFACTNCISGVCRDCVEVLQSMGSDRPGCPRCQITGAQYKPFMLDLK